MELQSNIHIWTEGRLDIGVTVIVKSGRRRQEVFLTPDEARHWARDLEASARVAEGADNTDVHTHIHRGGRLK